MENLLVPGPRKRTPGGRSLVVRPRGLEPLFRKEAEPKSAAYTIFATGAYSIFSAGGGGKTFTEVTAPKSNESTNSTTSAYE